MNNYKDSTATVVKMSFPIFMELLLQMLVGNIDQFMISQYSQASVAAIGNGNQIMNIVIIFVNAMSAASTILISKSLGANDNKNTSEICHVSLFVITVLSLGITVILVGGNRLIFTFMRTPEEIMGETCGYLVIVAALFVAQGLYMAFAAILRSFSMVKEVMIISIIMNVCNIIGNAILINGLFGLPRLGIIGAAISTDISKVLGLILIFGMFLKKTDIHLSIKNLRPFPKRALKNLLGIGIPSSGEMLSYQLAQLVILAFINVFGTAIIATRVYCNMMANIAYVYSVAISQATQIVVGYLIGSGQNERVPKRSYTTLIICWIVSLSITVLLWINSDLVLGIFTKDPVVLELGKRILFVELFLEIGRSVNILMVRVLVSIGDVMYPITIGIASQWIISVGVSYLFGVIMGYGLVGIWIAMAIDEGVRGLLFLIRFKTKGMRLLELNA